MGRLRLAAAECTYQELDRQLKEQFIYGLNDKDMLGEIIKEIRAARGNDHITSGNVLAWAQRAEAQRAQSAVMNSITEFKEFDKIKVSRSMCKESSKRPAQSSTPAWYMCRYCSSSHPPRQCLAYGKVCMECNKIGHFQRVCRSKKSRAVHKANQKTMQDKASEDIEMGSVNSVWFNIN